MMSLLAVGAGGFLGAALRWGVGLIPVPESAFPYVTLFINVLGSLAIGILSGLIARTGLLGEGMKLFLKVGFCGGFTTFSTFALETQGLLSKGSTGTALVYALLSVCLCVCAVFFGDSFVKA